MKWQPRDSRAVIHAYVHRAWSLQQLADACGVHRRTVAAWLVAEGVPLRPRGRASGWAQREHIPCECQRVTAAGVPFIRHTDAPWCIQCGEDAETGHRTEGGIAERVR